MAPSLEQAELAAFKRMLQTRRSELRKQIHEQLLRADRESYVELAGLVHDAEEQALADLLVDVELADIDRHVRELREVEAALERIAEGRYGICEDTGEPIPVERLRVEPTARRTVEAQAEYERAHGEDRHPSL